MFGLLVLLSRRAGDLSDADLKSVATQISNNPDGAFFALLLRLREMEPETTVSDLLSSDSAEYLIRKALG